MEPDSGNPGVELHSQSWAAAAKTENFRDNCAAFLHRILAGCNEAAEDGTFKFSLGVARTGLLYARMEVNGQVTWANGQSFTDLLADAANRL